MVSSKRWGDVYARVTPVAVGRVLGEIKGRVLAGVQADGGGMKDVSKAISTIMSDIDMSLVAKLLIARPEEEHIYIVEMMMKRAIAAAMDMFEEALVEEERSKLYFASADGDRGDRGLVGRSAMMKPDEFAVAKEAVGRTEGYSKEDEGTWDYKEFIEGLTSEEKGMIDPEAALVPKNTTEKISSTEELPHRARDTMEREREGIRKAIEEMKKYKL